ncbi:MAG: CDP-alcohol phosphatidyltransferase family protein [Ardenticatenaceae bacterium]|nr:CDP-alcohol phosphatidyltransferase family protein [Ardenticatenaceae bacterium]MCB8989395.1 CDP-alcohol phosphatidyltransferase family protein [Ardenticatenaceae bacterium]MCB9004550.1 CDP-alcohol phosphatidyltransferase family protein [Ardenticatenaceae bacterium]
MFDHVGRDVKERVFTPVARPLQQLHPVVFTWLALAFGLATAVLLWQQQYIWALLCWALNRVLDALDGTIARLTQQQSDLGGYLDIVLDFVIYAAIPIGLVWGNPSPLHYQMLAILLGVFYVNAASWMYLAAILEKRAQGAAAQREETTITMPAGLVGGVETILFYGAFALFPTHIVLLFGVMAGLTAVSVVQRLVWAARNLA